MHKRYHLIFNPFAVSYNHNTKRFHTYDNAFFQINSPAGSSSYTIKHQNALKIIQQVLHIMYLQHISRCILPLCKPTTFSSTFNPGVRDIDLSISDLYEGAQPQISKNS
jgi:hypothetical protein